MAGRLGTDAFQDMCQREHQLTLPEPDGRVGILAKLEAEVEAGHSLSDEQLAERYGKYSPEKLQEKLDRAKKLVADGQVQRTGNVDLPEMVAELEHELKRRERETSKTWLAKAKDAQRKKSPSATTGAEHESRKHHSQGRHMSANKGRPNGSVGNKQVAAALQGSGKGLFVTPQTGQKKARINALQFQSSGSAAAGTPMQRCVTCKKSVPVGGSIEGADPFLCHECIHVDGMATRSIKGKGKAADQTVEDDPFADLRDYSDQETAGTIADEAGPSSLPHKENMRPAPERISGHTRAQQPRRDLVDTRTIAVPSLKGLNGSAGSAVEGRLRSAAPREGTDPEAFYSLRSGASPQQQREDSPGPLRRQSTRGQKRKAEQSNEPITLDDSDEEDGAAGADKAEPALRRTTRSTAYKGPADTFKGLKALYPEDGGPGAVEVVPGDLVRLQPGEFLNDTIIDFYMRWIWQHLPEATQRRCYFFNSFFYKKLSEKQAGVGPLTASGRCEAAKAAHERVRKWTKGVDIFEKDFLFLPIHDHLHWSLVIICHPGVPAEEDSCTSWILHLDSMTSGHSTPKIRKELLAYLTQEWDQKVTQGGESRPALWAIGHREEPMRKLDIGVKRLALPLQDNYCDCGLFLLTYTDYFTHSLPAAVRTKNRKSLEPNELEGLSTYPLFMQKHWFQPDNAGALRAHIKTIVLELFLAQVPESQKEALADALTFARIEVEEYREDSQVPKYLSPAEYKGAGQEKREALKRERDEKAAKAARDKADKAASKEDRVERAAKLAAAAERRMSQGQLDISKEVVPRIPDTDDEGEGRPARRAGARRSGSVAPSSNGSGDIEVNLDDDVTPSATPSRQLRSPAERSPTAKVAAAMAEKLQQNNQEPEVASRQKGKADLDSRNRKRAKHIISDGEEASDLEVGGTPEPGQTVCHETLLLKPEYAGRFKFKWRFSPPRVLVADLSKCSALGPSEGDWRSFPSEAAAEEWCEALDSAQADVSTSAPMRLENFQDCTVYHPGGADEAAPSIGAHPTPPECPYTTAHGAVVTTGGTHLPGLVDDGPEDLTADDGPEPQAEQIARPDPDDDQIRQIQAGFDVLQSVRGAAQPSHSLIGPCPEYLIEAAASKSAESLAQANAAAEQLKQEVLPGGIGARHDTGNVPQQLGCADITPSEGARRYRIGVQNLLGILKPSIKEPLAFAEPQKVYQRHGKHIEKRQKSCADMPDIETSSEAAQGGDCTAGRAEDSHIDLTSDCEAPAAHAASGRAAAPSPSRRTAAPEAEANGNSCPAARRARSPSQSREAKVDCSNRQHRQGSESRHEHMQSKTQNKGSPPTTDSSQEPVSDCAGDSTYVPHKEASRQKKDCWHKKKECRHKRKKPERVVRPESETVERVQDNLGHMKLQPDKDGAAGAAAPREDAAWRTKKRSASNSPLTPARKPLSAPQIRSDGKASHRPQWDGATVHPWHAAPPQQPRPISQHVPRG